MVRADITLSHLALSFLEVKEKVGYVSVSYIFSPGERATYQLLKKHEF